MLLYILYIEPLLVYIEKRVLGYRINNLQPQQSLEAYCDDVNIVTSNLEDLNVVDRAVCEFEVCSGAILSRNMKCKIMGIGAWKDRACKLLAQCERNQNIWCVFDELVSSSYSEKLELQIPEV